jgi:hypothetical protein
MHKIFESNPQLKKVYVTSDDEAFYQETDAKNHAKTLDDKTVEPLYNEFELTVVDEEELTAEQLEMAEFEAQEKANELKTALEAFNTETTDYQTAVKLFGELGLETESKKKEVIYPLLAKAKEAQSQK